MVIDKAWRTLVVFVLVSTCCIGCARPKPTGHLSIYNDRYATKDTQTPPAPQKTDQAHAVTMTPFQEIVVSLVSDSMDLLPKSTSDSIFTTILKGIEIPDQYDVIERSVLSSSKKEDIAFVAGLIVQRVYSKRIEKGTTKPQTIIYFYKDKVTYTDLTTAAAKVNSSENHDLDAYNASLNLLVNTLSNNYAAQQKPADGLYARDSKEDLYFLTKMNAMEMR